MQPEISIIVPVYNLEKLITRCLDSIKAQTFQNWQCIVVNDGSSDGSGAVCDAYAKTDDRFQVLHQQNGGVSSARNAGLDVATGRYIAFVDGDDAVHARCFEWILEQQQQTPMALLAWFSASSLDAPVSFESVTERSYTSQQRQLFTITNAGSNIWNKLFWGEVIRRGNVRYDVSMKRGEDYAFCVAYLDAQHALFPESAIRVFDITLYYCLPDNTKDRASQKTIAAHPIVWDKQQSRGYAARLMQEYAQLVESMNGYEAMSATDRLHITHQYARRFAFAVWAAHQLGETLPEGFWGEGAVGGLVATMKHYKLYNAYYWPLRLKWQWLVCKTYHSDESESKKLFWRVHLAGDILLGRTWSRL